MRRSHGCGVCGGEPSASRSLTSQTVAQSPSVTQPMYSTMNIHRVRREIQRRVAPRRAPERTSTDLHHDHAACAPPTPSRPSASHVRLRTPYPCELNTCERPGRRPTGAPPYAMCHAPDSAPFAPFAHAPPPHARRLTPPPRPPCSHTHCATWKTRGAHISHPHAVQCREDPDQALS
jgi:hypothetical protein